MSVQKVIKEFDDKALEKKVKKMEELLSEITSVYKKGKRLTTEILDVQEFVETVEEEDEKTLLEIIEDLKKQLEDTKFELYKTKVALQEKKARIKQLERQVRHYYRNEEYYRTFIDSKKNLK